MVAWIDSLRVAPERKAEIEKRYQRIVASREASQERTKMKPKQLTQAQRQRASELARLRNRERRKTDVHFRIKANLSSRLSHIPRGFGGKGSCKTMTVVGCSRDELMRHLESQFQVGMAWNNYGQWEVDHIIECYKFDFRKEEDIRKCWNYTNLRPLWARDNKSRLRKRNGSHI